MRIVLTLLVRDEAEIIEDVLRFHYASGVDFVIATDNGSTDGTVEILERYERADRLRLIHQPGDGYEQAAWVTRMARLAATDHGADWVINGDADEFHLADGLDLKAAFASVPEQYGSVVLPVSHFRPRPCEQGLWFERLVVRESYSTKPRSDAPLVNVAHRATPDIVVQRGNHAVAGPGLEPAPAWHPVLVLHAPWRTRTAFESKLRKYGPLLKDPTGDYSLDEQLAVYDRKLVDDAAVVEGIRGGELLYDDRLATCLRALRAGADPPPPAAVPVGGGPLAWPDEPPAIGELRVAAARAAYLAEHAPPAQELRSLRAQVDRWQEKADHWRREAQDLSEKLKAEESADAERRRAAQRLAVLEASRWVRAGKRMRLIR